MDKATCNKRWLLAFPKANVVHSINFTLDHTYILINASYEDEFLVRPFRFIFVWLRDKSCKELVGG